jgi:hypothetical protein
LAIKTWFLKNGTPSATGKTSNCELFILPGISPEPGGFLLSVTCIFTIVAKFCGNNLSHTQNFATSPSSSSPDVSLSLLGWRRRACFLGELDDKVNPGYVLTLVPIGKETAPTVA